MKRVLITGGSGFIGYRLARYHVERGDFVFIIDNFFKHAGKPDKEFSDFLACENVQLFEMDMTAPIVDSNLPTSLDIVYHLAAINGTRLFYEIPYRVARTNLLVTVNLLDWLKQIAVNRLVYASSSEVYADSENVGLLNIPTEETVPVVFTQPTNVRFSYGTSKFMGEFLCLQFPKVSKTKASVVRYHNIYGPRMGTKHVIPEFIARLKSRENPLRIYGGAETRAFCFVDDAVEATHLVAQTEACEGEVIHVGNSAEEIAIKDLAGIMMELMGIESDIIEQGGRSGSVKRRCPNTSKLLALTGFSAEVNLRDGLSMTIDWYMSYFQD